MTALYCNEGPQGSAWADVMARLRHAILPEINADSTFLALARACESSFYALGETIQHGN